METISNQYEMTTENSPIKTAIIKLKNSQYEGLNFFFGQVKIAEEENEDGSANCKFDFEVVDNPNDVDIDSVDFHNHLGDILVDIILNNVSDEVENDREDNTEPPA